MPGKRRSAAQLARDRRKIADLYLKGWIQADIADEIGMSQATVSNDIAALHRDWLALALVDFNEAKAQELAKIDRLEREYWAAWERSCEDAETITEKARASRGSDKPDSVEKTKQAKGQAGDPRFLAGVQWCIEQRCKILGIEAPKRIEAMLSKRRPEEFTNDELAAIAGIAIESVAIDTSRGGEGITTAQADA